MEGEKEDEILNINFNTLNDYEYEFLLELAAQIYGYEPSDMWGKLTRIQATEYPELYDLIAHSQSKEHLNEMNSTLGGGFHSVMKKILNTARDILKGVHKGANYLSENPHLKDNLPVLNKLSDENLKMISKKSKLANELLGGSVQSEMKETFTTYGQPQIRGLNEYGTLMKLYKNPYIMTNRK